MFGKLAKMFAYVKAPVKTFALLHPIKMLKYGAVIWVGKKLFFSERRDDAGETEPATSPEPATGSPAPGGGAKEGESRLD